LGQEREKAMSFPFIPEEGKKKLYEGGGGAYSPDGVPKGRMPEDKRETFLEK